MPRGVLRVHGPRRLSATAWVSLVAGALAVLLVGYALVLGIYTDVYIKRHPDSEFAALGYLAALVVGVPAVLTALLAFAGYRQRRDHLRSGLFAAVVSLVLALGLATLVVLGYTD